MKKNTSTSHALINRISFDRLHNAEKALKEQYGLRYTRYREEFEAAGRMEFEPDFPLYIMPEQTYKCNFKCISCIHGYPEHRKKYDMKVPVMPWELYERIVLEGEEHGCPSIATHNNDEPLLVKDLSRRIAFARKHGFIEVIMTTNGLLLTRDIIKEIIDAGVTRILFSIDAFSEQTYSRMRPGGTLDKVKAALETTLETRENAGTALPIIRVSFVPNKINQHELKEFYQYYSKIVDYIDVQPFCTYYDTNKHLIPDNSNHIIDYPCNCPWRYAIIRADGDMLPCPNFYGAELVIGNIYKKSIYQLFNSSTMKSLRQELKNRIYSHPACATCAQSAYITPQDSYLPQ